MADMISNELVSSGSALNLLAGESLEIKVLNSDGSVKTVVYSAKVPTGKNFSGNFGLSGTLS